MIRHAFATMGTVVSLVVDRVPDADAGEPTDVFREVERVFARYDERFSLYSPTSELCRVADGRLALTHASEQLRDVYAQALQWRDATRGAFTPHRPDGVIDLSGIVKALAIRDAGDVLDSAAATSWMLGCGGDILLGNRDGATSTIGIADPHHAGGMLTAVEIGGARRAIATSGVSERGEHIWGRREAYDQVSVIADDIVTADVIATAVLAGDGDDEDVTATVDVDLLAIRRDGVVVATPGIRLAAPALAP